MLRTVLLGFIFLFVSTKGWGTHIRAAEIKVERACNSMTVTIFLTVYMNTTSQTQFGGNDLSSGHINFGDGITHIIPITPYTLRPDLGANIGVATYQVSHTYTASQVFKITYFERDRSSGILNIPNSFDVAFATSSYINLTDPSVCNQYPILGIPPVDLACIGRIFSHNAGAVDPDGDSLSYAFVVPAKSATQPVDGYKTLTDPTFYPNHAIGNEAGTGPPSLTIDPITGIISWDAPGLIGEYNIAFEIVEWRKNNVTDQFEMLSTTIRDMQIIVLDCQNNRPDITLTPDACVFAGTIVNRTVTGIDPDDDPIKIEAISDAFSVSNPALLTPAVPSFQPSPDQQQFYWATNCTNVRDQPYQVIYKVTDGPAHQTNLVTFKSWSVKVMAPAPQWNNAGLDLVNRQVSLAWQDYSCQNANTIQVWRKVGTDDYGMVNCQTGLPKNLGYKLIAELDGEATSFIDNDNENGLAAGAYYCYRLVATFDSPIATSVVSDIRCFGPIEADQPIITHVTVDETGISNGKKRVSWRSPFEINTAQFPEPFLYEVYRGDGFSNATEYELVGQRQSDTTLVDLIDTKIGPHHYTVVVYSQIVGGGGTYYPVDTASFASSVFLEVQPGPNGFDLTWSAVVPWSNTATGNPWHYIYRSDAGGASILIDSVKVSEEGFEYHDTGQFNGISINNTQSYCYQVKTVGTYGNPSISLQENLSQTVCMYLDNTLPLCTPVVTIDLYDCEQFLAQPTCGPESFINSIYWSVSGEQECRNNIKEYKIYVSSNNASTDFEYLTTVRDTFFIENNLASLARCYRVQAVDLDGNESEMSEMVCNDNCPYFELPNVFTPNGDGCNDFFGPFVSEQNSTCTSAADNHCPRFVEQLTLEVFNRWGRSVYSYDSSQPNGINIFWDGKDKNGDELDAGTYYYLTTVTFDVVDPAFRKREYKGWVMIQR